VRVVFIGGIMRVHDARPGCAQDRDQVIPQCSAARVFYGSAGVVEMDHGAVMADLRGAVLFIGADRAHFSIGAFFVGAGACAACAIRTGDAAKPFRDAVVAGDDAVEGHELEIILMRADAEMGDARERIGLRSAVRDEDLCIRVAEYHGF